MIEYWSRSMPLDNYGSTNWWSSRIEETHKSDSKAIINEEVTACEDRLKQQFGTRNE